MGATSECDGSPWEGAMVCYLGAEQRRALTILATEARGTTEATLLRVHGFTFELLTGLMRDGLAAVETETAGGRTIEVVRVRITVAGWRALEGSTNTE